MRLLLVLALALLSGCELIANIPNGTLVTEPGDCTTGELACAAPTPICNVDTATCVECLGESDCPGQRPFCDLSINACDAGCFADAECDSGACLPDRTCADASRVRYAAVAGTGDCSRASPCTLDTALGQLGPGVDVVQLAAGTYDIAATIAPATDVIFNGTDVTFRKLDGNGNVIQYSGVAVTLHRIAFQAPDVFAVNCTMPTSKLTAVGIRVEGAIAAVFASECEVHVDRALISGNEVYGMFISNSKLTLTNSFITKNSSATFALGGLLLDNLQPGSVVEHNTIADNINNGTAPSGLNRCLGGAMFTATIRNNIVRNNSIAPECTITSSVIDPGYTGAGTGNLELDPLFVDPAANNYRLMPGSPVAGMADPSAPVVFFDHDGEPRPESGNPDPGADEIP